MDLNIKEILNSISLSKDIEISDIPNMNLYMEQLTDFIDNSLKDLKRNDSDKILTKTMINSYTKDGLLMPPENKKKYTKQHIILLILIYHLKQVLSINDIKSLMKPILNDINTDKDDLISLEDIYSIFLETKNMESSNYYNLCKDKVKFLEKKIDEFNIQNDDVDIVKLFLIVVTLIAQAESSKRLAEKIIDTYFVSK
ncbi:DUF1836 domain-containing protein [Clostridium fallax]|uniref:DUF1836 domain-containing protein n=1 Tax=Clostridium fallax TaxID=1533 RepID=A0A1M4XKF4_9CLOT|nr:DUF1836 domain-containing protein [Clostridium fallax]SHE93682.1 protein of unknown function [Clostridium fallax]SQB06379.1 protein of uncharacterised function (DUF1836) [Clostridium fallax]